MRVTITEIGDDDGYSVYKKDLINKTFIVTDSVTNTFADGHYKILYGSFEDQTSIPDGAKGELMLVAAKYKM